MTGHVQEPQMWISGSQDGVAVLVCSRQECRTDASRTGPGDFWCQQDLKWQAQPSDIVDAWERHKLVHATTGTAERWTA